MKQALRFIRYLVAAVGFEPNCSFTNRQCRTCNLSDPQTNRLIGGPTDGLMDGWMGRLMDRWMGRLMDGPTGRLMDGPTGGLMDGPTGGLDRPVLKELIVRN